MKFFDKTEWSLLYALPVLIILLFVLPTWLVNYVQVSMGMGLVALAVMIQMRAGLVSFGQGLYFCIGGYTAGMASKFWNISDIFVIFAIAIVATLVVAGVLGFLLRRYREIFFAMLTLAVSMILFALLSSSHELGSTDGFNLPQASYLGWRPEGETAGATLFILTAILTLACAILINRFLRGPIGKIIEAIRENELRVEYLGASAHVSVHILYMVAAVISAIGGVLWAMALGHVTPEMANWTTSGQFVFIVILAGTGNVFAPLIGTLILEVLRVYAVEISPNTWQMILGTVMLLTIVFLPKGLWSLFEGFVKRLSSKEPAA